MSDGLARMSAASFHQLSVFSDRKLLLSVLSQVIQDKLAEALQRRKKASMALAGGTTPAPLYEALSHAPLAWDRISLTLTDERWVSPDDPASNEFLIRGGLMKRRAAAATFYPLKTNHAHASGGAAVAGKRIARIMPFDLCLLGMGADGHVASLFPTADGYAAAISPKTTRAVAAIHATGAAGTAERLTLTLNGLLASRRILVLFTGQDKLAVYTQAKAGDGGSPLRHLLAQNRVPLHVFWAE